MCGYGIDASSIAAEPHPSYDIFACADDNRIFETIL